MDEKKQHKGYVRGGGVANIITDPETRKRVAENTPFFKMFWQTPDDPSFTLLQIELERIEYMTPQGTDVFRFTL
jgi:general stress protein 26